MGLVARRGGHEPRQLEWEGQGSTIQVWLLWELREGLLGAGSQGSETDGVQRETSGQVPQGRWYETTSNMQKACQQD